MAKTRRKYKGNATPTTIAGGLSSGSSSCVIGSSTGWPSSGPFYAVVDPGSSSEEKILVGSISGTTISSITRGVDDTTDQSHSAGCTIYPVFTAIDADEANELTSTYSAQGHIVYQGASTFTGLAIGTAAQVLKVNSGATAPEWGQVATAGIADSAVTSAKIADGTIVAGDIASDAVTTAKILDSNVTTAKIADGAVTEAKLDSSLPKGIVGEIKTVTSTFTSINGTTITGTTMSSYTYATDRVYRFSWRGARVVNGSSTTTRSYEIRLYDGTDSYGIAELSVPPSSTVWADNSYLFTGDGTAKQFRLWHTAGGSADVSLVTESGKQLQFWVEDLGKL